MKAPTTRNRRANKRGAQHKRRPAGSKAARLAAEQRFGN